MSFYQLDRGLSPLGSLFAGALADLLGAPSTIAVLGLATAVAALGIGGAGPRLRRIE
jgi:hypothetical protein